MEIFDPVLFVRLALASDWKKFTIEEQAEFSNVFSRFLCRYYLPRLQERYGGERVNFTKQKFRSENRVSIEAEVLWEGLKVPIEVRMVLTGGQWKAYDLVVSGISAVMIYRAQFRAVLRKGSPADLIDEIRGKIDSTRDGPYMPS
jgi:phospholipid transport system substrate-binding protein